MDPRKVEKNAWIFPFIGGILSIIAVATPASYFNVFGIAIYTWMWGVSVGSMGPYGTTTGLLQDSIGIAVGIICAIIILIAGISMLWAANRVRKRRKKAYQAFYNWLGTGILSLIVVISWMISVEISFQSYMQQSMGSYYSYYSYFHFWGLFQPGFGVIGVFLSGIMGIIGFISVKVTKNKRNIGIVKTKVEYKETPQEFSEFKKGILNFCPKCGTQIGNSALKFCITCGMNFDEIK